MNQASNVKGPWATVGDSITATAPETCAAAEAWGKKSHSCKRLPKEFRRGGFTYRQIAREGDSAIYEKMWSGCSEPSVCYEVIRIREREGFQIGGRFVEAAEVYPNSEAWGVDGFTLTDRDAAFVKLSLMHAIPICRSVLPALQRREIKERKHEWRTPETH